MLGKLGIARVENGGRYGFVRGLEVSRMEECVGEAFEGGGVWQWWLWW